MGLVSIRLTEIHLTLMGVLPKQNLLPSRLTLAEPLLESSVEFFEFKPRHHGWV